MFTIRIEFYKHIRPAVTITRWGTHRRYNVGPATMARLQALVKTSARKRMITNLQGTVVHTYECSLP